MKFMQIEPQVARGTLTPEEWGSSIYFAEEKYDGDRRIAQVCGEIVRFTGRRKSVKDGKFVEKSENIPHLSGVLHRGDRNIPLTPVPDELDGTVLDGEIVINPDNAPNYFVDEGRSKYVTSIMGSLPDEAIQKQKERGWLVYIVFDCLFANGEDIRDRPLSERRQIAAKAVRAWRNGYVRMAAKYADVRQAYKEVVGRGGEGIIIKEWGAKYGDRRAWTKVKKQATADVVITGFKAAKEVSKKKGDDEETMTKYAREGLIGAILCGQMRNGRMVEVASISGFDDGMRRDMTRYPDKYTGSVIEIKHNGREPTGRFRHPRFGRFRPDKDPKDCKVREGEV